MTAAEAPEDTEPDNEPADKLCALDGCDNPIPPPAVDEHGRRKGGRPSSYCCKAHADAASRARRAAATDAIARPLDEVRTLTQRFEPAAAQLTELLQTMRDRFAEAEDNALARITETEAEAQNARNAAAQAEHTAQKAETRRAEALAAARDDRRARQEAEQAADKATHDAAQETAKAWTQVAEHERARGAAEAAAAAAHAGRDELIRELRIVRERFDELHARERSARQDLAQRDTLLAERTGERDHLATELHSARQDHTQLIRERDDTRAELRALHESARQDLATERQRLTHALDELAGERTARKLAEQHAATLQEQLTAARGELATAHQRLDALLATLMTTPDQPEHESQQQPDQGQPGAVATARTEDVP